MGETLLGVDVTEALYERLAAEVSGCDAGTFRTVGERLRNSGKGF
jgi:hypothetical protein